MRVVKPLIDALALAGLAVAFYVLLAPVYAPVLVLNAVLFATAAILVFGGWGRKLMAAALVIVAGAATLSIPFLQADRTVFITVCPDRSFDCARLHPVRFHEERGVIVGYPDDIRADLASVFAQDTSLVFRIEPVQGADGWGLAAPTESRLIALAAAGEPPIVSYGLALGPAQTRVLDLRRLAPEDVRPEPDGATARTLESRVETGVAAVSITIDALAAHPDEGFFAVRTREPPDIRALRALLVNELSHRSIQSGATQATDLSASVQDGGLPLHIAELAVLARTDTGSVLTPRLQAQLARFCRSQGMLDEPPLLSAAQAYLLAEVIARGNPPDADAATTPAANRLGATAVRFCGGFASDLARGSDRLASPSTTEPAWRRAIAAAANQLGEGRPAMTEALAAAPGSNAQKTYLACTELAASARRSGFSRVERMLAGDDPSFNARLADSVGTSDEPAMSVLSPLIDVLRPVLAESLGADSAAARAARAECDHWNETLGPFDALSQSLIEPNQPEAKSNVEAIDAVLPGVARRAEMLATQLSADSSESAADPVAWVGMLVDAPALRDERLAGWTLDQDLSLEQAQALLGEPGNFPVALLLASQRMPRQLGATATAGERASAETAARNARALISAAETRALDLDMAGLIYALKLSLTGQPDPALSRRFADEIGRDPDWVCLLLQDRGDGALCREDVR